MFKDGSVIKDFALDIYKLQEQLAKTDGELKMLKGLAWLLGIGLSATVFELYVLDKKTKELNDLKELVKKDG